jgi:hypothetical protein
MAGASFVRRHRPTWAIAALAAVLLAGVGAYGTGNAAPWTLYSYWAILTLSGSAFGALASDWLEARGRFRPRSAAELAGLLLAVSLPLTPLVYVLSGLALNGSWHWQRLPHLWTQVLFLAALLLPLQQFVERRLPQPQALPPERLRGPCALLGRLPVRLRDANIQAVEAEDHYLRIHTDAGSALVLMKLSDALAELDPAAGMQTHRSWWVAREAVIDCVRGRGRALLTLRSGLQVPVSRTFAPALRRRGWF